MNRLVIIGLTIIMFFFKNSATSNELKNFYDLEIENINGDIINIKDYENKNSMPIPMIKRRAQF